MNDCTKCCKPILSNLVVECFGVLYHPHCVPKNVRVKKPKK